ncbi:Hypothetical protein GbCGDNIH9_8049 [Granulibacter bethesdensis]|uniref:Uncharacterized protein n=1 Tax=Granulibacter bethesdensis TaxID=364410 RepID=A0AAC9KAI6_9PROT|nr:Hypothetical protein GbCGDNIH9_8049 [Granulibacter bethesdensis]APH62378.1 Hypothetical protein GbCGDNIH8_8577 [Granulibacter bethesdensis]
MRSGLCAWAGSLRLFPGRCRGIGVAAALRKSKTAQEGGTGGMNHFSVLLPLFPARPVSATRSRECYLMSGKVREQFHVSVTLARLWRHAQNWHQQVFE